MHRTVRTTDGRDLVVELRGDPSGRPVFLMHGTPGSRLAPAPRPSVLYRMGVRLITYDRPGYGGSDRQTGRRVASAAEDVRAIADVLGLAQFAVAGRGGGAPHALACAALLPDRVLRAAALASLAPWDASGLDWFEGMTAANVRGFEEAGRGHQRLAGTLEFRAQRIRSDPIELLRQLAESVAPPDRPVVSDPGMQGMLERNYSEALRSSADGWIDDVLAFTAPWGFAPAAISVPVLLWHGEQDVISPAGHSRWLAARIPSAQLVLAPGRSHFGAISELTSILRWLAA